MRYAVLLAGAFSLFLSAGGTAIAQETLYAAPRQSHYDHARAQAELAHEFSSYHHRLKAIREAQRRGYWETMLAIEASAIPVIVDSPIVYPTARRWQELTYRRRALYGSTTWNVGRVTETRVGPIYPSRP